MIYTIQMGEISGYFFADCREEALDLFAQDAGYRNWADAVSQGLASDDTVHISVED